MEALALPIISFAIQHVPDLLGVLAGDKAGSIAGKVVAAANEIFGTIDPEVAKQAAAAKIEEFKATVSALVASDTAQGNVNAEEAKSPFFFVAGWRPFIGWVCGYGLAYQYGIQPLLEWLSKNMNWVAPAPLDLTTLLQLLVGMLGLGTLRYLDKKDGTDTKSILAPFARKK